MSAFGREADMTGAEVRYLGQSGHRFLHPNTAISNLFHLNDFYGLTEPFFVQVGVTAYQLFSGSIPSMADT
jgi:hypothetical protein